MLSIMAIPLVNHFVHSSMMKIPTETVEARVACLVENMMVGKKSKKAW